MSVSSMEFTSALQKLGAYQPRENAKSKEFLAKAPSVLAGLKGSKQDPESTSVAPCNTFCALLTGRTAWDVLEKLYLASLDEGNMEIANVCTPSSHFLPLCSSLHRLCQEALVAFSRQFPDSTRVDCLQGIMIEVRESPDMALQYYDALLKADSSNAVRVHCAVVHVANMLSAGTGRMEAESGRS